MTIYKNGYIQEVSYPETSFDEHGRPIPSDGDEGELIPCMFRATVEDKRGEGKDGKRSRGAYEVHVEPMSVTAEPMSVTAERIRLYRGDESLVGEFTVQSWAKATLLNFTKIVLD